MAEFIVEFMPGGQTISVAEGTNLLEAARAAGLTPNAPCGGKGTCGKCKVRLLHLPDTPEVLACQTAVEGPMTVRFLSDENKSQVISTSSNLKLGRFPADSDSGYCVAFDIGTTTVALYLCDLQNGKIKTGEMVTCCRLDGTTKQFRIQKLFGYYGYKRIEIEEAEAGDLIAIAGLADISVGETICNNNDIKPFIRIEEIYCRFLGEPSSTI